MSSRIFGSSVRRREDPRLITGTATYTDDLTLPGMVHAVMLRSPHAHARVKRIDVSRAIKVPGVQAVCVGQDVGNAMKANPCAWLVPNANLKVASYPMIANDVVRYVGDIVAVVVADTNYLAYDALGLVEVDYEPLPAVVGPKATVAAGAPQLHPDIPHNEAFHWVVAGGDIDAAFKNADIVIKEHIVQQRLIPNTMEPRATLAQWTRATGELTVWSTTQNPHILRFLCSLVLSVPEDKLRVIAPEVGGGFGSKIAAYPADFITAFCAMRLGRPVKWTETRSENYQATTHGRDRPRVRQRRLCRRFEKSPGTRQVRRPAPRADEGPAAGPVRRDWPGLVRRAVRSGSIRRGGRRRLPGRPVGECHRARAPDRQSARVHRLVSARPGRRDDVRPDRGE